MRRTILFALMMSLLLMGGCGRVQAEEKFEDWQEELREEESFSFSAKIAADSGENVLRYEATARWEDGETCVELTAPEVLAGVTLRMSDDTAFLEYDGVSLELGKLPGAGMSPAAVLPLAAKALRDGHLLSSAAVREDGVTQIVCELACEWGELTVWMEGEPLMPVHAELSVDGQTVVTCEFIAWNTEYKEEV
ncbi:MAG: hypothetical protein Q4A39_01350 [Eubacteriales bacterium]|nr:hypothetical protein [Eubacteriales bacterium]